MSKKDDYPKSRHLIARLQCLIDALSYSTAILTMLGELDGLDVAAKDGIAEALVKNQSAMNAVCGEDEK